MAETPSRVMYDALKACGIKMNEAAASLLDPDFKVGGKTMREKITDRTYLNRYVVNVEPGMIPLNAFKDFSLSAQVIAGQIARKSYGMAIAYLSSDAVNAMASALETYGQSPHVFKNMAASIAEKSDIPEGDKLTLLVLLFVTAGCTGNSLEACNQVQLFSINVLARSFHTEILVDEGGAAQNAEHISQVALAGAAADMWLFRRVSATQANPTPYKLSTDPEGTVVGRNPSAASCIDDVDSLVSANHLRIWRAEDGYWYAEGMGSTNGSELVSGEDRSVQVIEPPASKRQDWQSIPVRILPGDTLRLARTTEFVVVS